MISTHPLLNLVNGTYGISIGEILKFLKPSDAINIWDCFDLDDLNLNNVCDPVHRLLLDLKLNRFENMDYIHSDILIVIDEIYFKILRSHDYSIFSNPNDLLQNICELDGEIVSLNLKMSISICALIKQTQAIDYMLQYLSEYGYVVLNSHSFIHEDDEKFFFLHLTLGWHPDTAEWLINILTQNIPFLNSNQEFCNSIISDIFVSLSVWGHFDTIDILLKKFTQIDRNILNIHCRKVLKIPLLLGLIDAVEYWYHAEDLINLRASLQYDFHLIPEISWIWLSSPDKKAFWETDEIFNLKVLQNKQLMKLIVKSEHILKSIIIKGLSNSMELDYIDLFNLLLDNLPSNFVELDKRSPISCFFDIFSKCNSHPAWYDLTDEDDKVLFERNELPLEDYNKRKRIRHYGRRILQIKDITDLKVNMMYLDIPTAKRLILFNWIGTSFEKDNFNYWCVIERLKFFIKLDELVELPAKDFMRISKCVIESEYAQVLNIYGPNFTDLHAFVDQEFGGSLKQILNNSQSCFINSLSKNVPIETVIFILHNSHFFNIPPPPTFELRCFKRMKLSDGFTNQLPQDLILKEGIDCTNFTILIEFLFHIINTEDQNLLNSKQFKQFKQDFDISRRKNKENGGQDIFLGFKKKNFFIFFNVLSDSSDQKNIISNLNICQLLKEKYEINLTIIIHNLCDLLSFPSLIEELPVDCFKIARTVDNHFFQTSFGKIVFEKDIEFDGNYEINYIHSFNLMKRLFNIDNDYLPTLNVKCIDLNSLWIAENYPGRINLFLNNKSFLNKENEVKFFQTLAKKQTIVNFNHGRCILSKVILDLFCSEGLKLNPLVSHKIINSRDYPSLNFLKLAIQDEKLKINVCLKTLQEYGAHPVFKEIAFSHKSQIEPIWYDISFEEVKKYYEILSQLKPCIFNFQTLRSSYDLWPIYIKKANAFPNLFEILYDKNLLNEATEDNSLITLWDFPKLGLPAKFSYESIQIAFQMGYIAVLNWWAKSGLLDPRFKLNLDRLARNPRKEKLLKWANKNKVLIDSISYSAAGIKKISDLIEEYDNDCNYESDEFESDGDSVLS